MWLSGKCGGGGMHLRTRKALSSLKVSEGTPSLEELSHIELPTPHPTPRIAPPHPYHLQVERKGVTTWLGMRGP